MKKPLLLFIVLVGFAAPVFAQGTIYGTQYRPDHLDWQELKTDHFRIIFPLGLDSSAFRAGRILESQLSRTYSLAGSSVSNFPIILTNYNDLTNGFVTSINFRSEVDLAPFKGKSINPQSGAWLEAVLPHELLHVSHTNVINPISFSGFLSVFSPDLGRTINFFPPLGVHEGLAVYHESTGGALNEYSGRSNYSYFTNRYNAIFTSDRRWSMSQHFVISDFTNPPDRHYLGGAEFTHWLHETYGEDVSKRAISIHQNLFFLGYGYALRKVTGKWPKQLYSDFVAYKEGKEANRKATIGESTDDFHTLIDSPFDGVRQRKPIWVTDDQLLFHARQYNAIAGFYKYQISSSETDKITDAFPVSDYYMDYDETKNTLFFPEYFSLGKYFGSYQTDIVELDVSSGRKNILTNRTRAFSPQNVGGEMLALRPDADFANLVRITNTGSAQTIYKFEKETPIGIEANPSSPDEFALIINRRGVQALWFTSLETMESDIENSPDIAFKGGSIHDATWHSSGEKIMFTVDRFPAMNVFEYAFDTGEITQLTNSYYNAYEPSYSPDDEHIAYVTTVSEESKIAILNRSDFYNHRVDESELLSGSELEQELTRPFLGYEYLAQSQDWTVSEYAKNASWLKPRLFLPLSDFHSTVDETEYGVYFTSVDALQSQSYGVQSTYFLDEFWYDVSYTNKTFHPGFSARFYKDPTFTSQGFRDGDGNVFVQNYLQQESGFEFSIPFEYHFKDLNRSTSLFVNPFLSLERVHLFDIANSLSQSNNPMQVSYGAFSQFNYKLVQLSRDIQPSSGGLLFAQLELAELQDPFIIEFEGDPYTSGVTGRSAVYAGANVYTNFFPRSNHSLLLEFRELLQSDSQLYSNDNIKPLGFPDNVFDFSSHLSRAGFRYTIPLTYADNGGFLVPLYLSNIYTSAFGYTVYDWESSSTRSILGAGLHFRFKISNLLFDLGAGFAFDPTTSNFEFILGDF